MRPRALSDSAQGGGRGSGSTACCADADPRLDPFPYLLGEPDATPDQPQLGEFQTGSVQADLAARTAAQAVRRTALGLVHTHVSLALAPTVLYTLAGWRLRSRGLFGWAPASLLVSTLFLLAFAAQSHAKRVTVTASVCVAIHTAGVVVVRFAARVSVRRRSLLSFFERYKTLPSERADEQHTRAHRPRWRCWTTSFATLP